MNPNWTERLFRKLHPDYRPRWMIYEELLSRTITNDTMWLDVGCGKNEHVASFGQKAKTSLGIDALDHQGRTDAPFLQADIHAIPLPSGSSNLITLCLVAEHLEKVPEDFSEIGRLLMPGGLLIVLTTNGVSPVIFFPRLLPYRLKKWIIQKIFGVQSHDVFPTYHRFNTSRKMKKGIAELSLIQLEYLEQVPLDKPIFTLIFGIWYSLVKLSPLRYFRSNLLAVFQKVSISNDAFEPRVLHIRHRPRGNTMHIQF